MTTQQTPIRCSNCGHQFAGEIKSVIDVSQDPQAKAQLLGDTLNNVPCPNCGAVNKVVVPLLYHDPDKELLVALVPMEIHADKTTQERIVGELMNQLPKDNFKGYMFNPRRALTMQGLIEQVLQADGISPEEWRARQDEQRAHIDIIQEFLNTESEEHLNQLIKQYDAELDQPFFQTLSAMIQTTMGNGRPDVAQQLMYLQNALTSLSSYGQDMIERQQAILQEVAMRVQQMGAGANRDDFFDLALEYADSPDHLRALVRMARPVFDYQFFQEMGVKTGQFPAAAREKVEQLRSKLLELTAALDQQAQTSAASLLQAAINHPEPEELLRANINAIDQTFMQVLRANIQHAEQQKNLEASTRLKEIERVINEIRSDMENVTNFARQLLGSDDPETLISENPDMIDDNLLTILLLNIEAAQQNGDTQAAEHMENLYNLVIAHLQENLQPELRLLNELLSVEDDETAAQMLHEHVDDFGGELLEIMDAVEQVLNMQEHTDKLERLHMLRDEARAAINV